MQVHFIVYMTRAYLWTLPTRQTMWIPRVIRKFFSQNLREFSATSTRVICKSTIQLWLSMQLILWPNIHRMGYPDPSAFCSNIGYVYKVWSRCVIPTATATDLLCPNMPYISTKGRGVRVSLPLYIKTCTKLCKMLQNKTEVLHQFILQALVTHTDSLPGTRLLGIDCFGSNDDAKSLEGRYVSLFFSSGQCSDCCKIQIEIWRWKLFW